MIDPRLSIIAAVLRDPSKPLKFFIETSEVSRATFFKAKSELVDRGIVRLVGRKKLEMNVEEARDFVSTLYPGLVHVFFGQSEAQDRPQIERPTDHHGDASLSVAQL